MVPDRLLPCDVEIRLIGTLSKSELVQLSELVVAKREAGELRGPWNPVNASSDWDPHHWQLGGYKLVTPLEVGTVQTATPAPSPQSGGLTLQVYVSLVPCYQVWLRVSLIDVQDPRQRWERLRSCYQWLQREAELFGLEPQVVIWTAALSELPAGLAGPEGRRDPISPHFFDLVLDQERSDYRAASWFGASFVGLHLAEGKEHFLVVDLDPSRPFRVSQFFYLLVGRTKLHELGEAIHGLAKRVETDPEVGGDLTVPDSRLGTNPPPKASSHSPEERESLAHLSVRELGREMDLAQKRRNRMAAYNEDMSRHLTHVDMLRGFVTYHTSGLGGVVGEQSGMQQSPHLPTVGAEMKSDLDLRYEGPLNEAARWAREIIRRAAERNEAREEFMRDRMSLLLTKRLWTYQWIVLALTFLALGLSLYSILR